MLSICLNGGQRTPEAKDLNEYSGTWYLYDVTFL